VQDGPGQRSWCLAAIATQVALPTYFDPAHATSNPFASAAAAAGSATSPRSGGDTTEEAAAAAGGSAPLDSATLLGKKLRPKVVTLLEQVLVAVGRSSALDR